MRIRFGYELVFECPRPTPMILMLHAHPDRIHDLERADDMRVEPSVPLKIYHDAFGNTCTRIEAPAGRTRITANGVIHDSGFPEQDYPFAREHPVSLLPDETRTYLLDSRYCQTEALMADAWRLFGAVRPGWARVQAICDFAHRHATLGYRFARPSKTVWQADTERQLACRDFAHLAITLCRCLNIPARYCTGYLGDNGIPPTLSTMDFSGWIEAYLGGRWHTFDPCDNRRRIGRILVARGRDAADVATITTFGPNSLQTLRVWADEMAEPSTARAAAHSYLDERFGHAT